MNDLYTFGELMAFFMAMDTDSVKTASQYQMSAAGAEANVAVAAHRLGIKVHFHSKVGNDYLGDAVIALIEKEGLSAKHFVRSDSYNGALVRNRGQEEKLDVTYLRKCAAASTFQPEDIDEEVLSKSKWVHATGITAALSESSRNTVAHALDLARKHNVRASFDLNIRLKLWSKEAAGKALKELTHDLELLTGGVDEYEIVFGGGSPEANLKIAADRGINTVIMTNGPEVMRILDRGERFDFEPHKVKIVDPVGSGDAAIAGTISGILAGLPLKEAIAQGSKCGAMVASVLGDWAGMVEGKGGLLP
jgi:2-dehydro-3-deoxygluconokinase